MTKQMTIPILLAVLLALSSSLALARNQNQSEHSKNCMQVRCWSQIDTNHDNLIEPQEWIKYEQTHSGPLAKRHSD